MQKAMIVRPEQASDIANLNSYFEKGWILKAMCATENGCLVVVEAAESEEAHKTLDGI